MNNHPSTLPPPPHGTLPLDAESLAPEALSMAALMRELDLQKKPSWMLARLMQALEEKRQEKGLGWSRPWNKHGLTIFRTHVPPPGHQAHDAPTLRPLLEHFLAEAPARYLDFARELLADPARMTFTFYHNHNTADGGQYEGLTLSLGRKVQVDRTRRDRLDIILEDERVQGRVDGLVDRLRLYVCPWASYAQGRQYHLTERQHLHGPEIRLAQTLYQHSLTHYHAWKADPARQWSHWSARYIDYFGPRTFIPQGSSFN